MPTPTKQQARALNDYLKHANEARAQIDALVPMLYEPALPMPRGVLVESAFLQIRLVCEVVALMCLTAHGDLDGTKAANIQSSYKADFILTKLEGLHANLYPVPVTVTDTPLLDGRTHHHMDPISSGFLKRAELINLYRKCGDREHRGSLAKFQLASDQVWEEDFKKLKEWRDKPIALLQTHLISSLDGRSH